MSTWRVHRHYGFGAAKVPLRARPLRAKSGGLREGLATMFREFFEGSPLVVARRIVAHTPALALGFLLLATFVTTLTRDHSDTSDIEVVMLQTPVLPVEDELPPPIEVAEVEPPPAPKPEPAKPEPPPEPKLVEKPPPPPEVVQPQPKPKARPRPKPVIPQIAKV